MRRRSLLGFFLCVLCVLRGDSSQAQPQGSFAMPDMKQMSGIPRPVTDLPDGAISVRLIRGDLSNNITNHPVELRAGGKTLTQKTDESGRAQFSGVTPGTTVKASAVVDGERLDSQEFPVPASGGVRLMLSVAERPEFDHPSSIFYFKVGDIQAVAATLESRGVQFEGPPHMIAKMPDHDLWMAFFRDVDGNLQALMSEVPRN